MTSTSAYYESYWAYRVQEGCLYRPPSDGRTRLALDYLAARLLKHRPPGVSTEKVAALSGYRLLYAFQCEEAACL